MDELDPNKIVVDEQGNIAIVEPERIVPAQQKPINLTELEQAEEAALSRAEELERQGNAALADAANFRNRAADFRVQIDVSKARRPVQPDDLEV